MKINTWLLVKAFSNKPNFIPCSRAIGILDESIIFFLHSLNPLRILESSGNSVGFREKGKYGGEAISRVGFSDGIFREGLHGMKV